MWSIHFWSTHHIFAHLTFTLLLLLPLGVFFFRPTCVFIDSPQSVNMSQIFHTIYKNMRRKPCACEQQRAKNEKTKFLFLLEQPKVAGIACFTYPIKHSVRLWFRLDTNNKKTRRHVCACVEL